MKYNIISHAKKYFFSLHFSTSRNMTRKKNPLNPALFNQ